MMLTAYLFYSFFGYLSGSVLYSYLIPKYFCHVDVRTVNEDQNPGAFNAFSVAGPRIGLLCVLCDIGKGFLPVFLAAHSSAVSMSSWIFSLILLAPVAGHAWPFLQPAKGGKAISVSFGVLLGLLPDLRPALLLAAFYLTFSLILIIQPHSLSRFLCLHLILLCFESKEFVCAVTARSACQSAGRQRDGYSLQHFAVFVVSHFSVDRRPSCRYCRVLAGLPTALPQMVTGIPPSRAASTTMRMSFFIAWLAGR